MQPFSTGTAFLAFDPVTISVIGGLATAAGSALATVISSWLSARRGSERITIQSEGKKVEFEAKDLGGKADQELIERINKLLASAETSASVTVRLVDESGNVVSVSSSDAGAAPKTENHGRPPSTAN
jgi:hypothetical protein